MNLDDAFLTQQVLQALCGSQGKSHGQLANECRVSSRRMTHHLFCLEKAGLVTTHANTKVTLADELASLALNHASGLEHNHVKQAGPAYSQQWKAMMMAEKALTAYNREFANGMFSGFLNDVFGGK